MVTPWRSPRVRDVAQSGDGHACDVTVEVHLLPEQVQRAAPPPLWLRHFDYFLRDYFLVPNALLSFIIKLHY